MSLALVTGAARGLGRGIALCLAEAGHDIVVNDLCDSPEAEETASQVRAFGRQAWVEPADVSDEAAVEALFARLAARGGVDVLVNNAGTTQAADIFSISLADWERILAINLRSCFLCSRQAAAQMRDKRYGRIVLIGSVSGQQGALYGHVHYSASKAGIVGFAKALARTLAPHGITVNTVAPGIIETGLLRATHGDSGVADLAQGVPLGLGTARDVGLAVTFLCGPGGRYITGATLDVNGGMYLR